MRYYGIVKDRENKADSWHFINFEQNSKTDFARDVNRNGYILRHNKVYTETEYKNLANS